MKIPDLPPITNGPAFLQRVRETLHQILGRTGKPEDRLVSVGELKDAGIVKLTGPTSDPVIAPGPSVGAPDPDPDLTPPPTPTGLTVTAGMTRLIIEWATPTYTAGRGHDRTIIYGATYSGSGNLPTFASAVQLKQALGAITDYVTNTGTQWHIWIKWQSKDGVLSSSPAGGTNGVTVTTGKVGTSDLNDLIITSQKLASGAVDALAKFGSGLEPVYNVSALPNPSGYAGPRTVFLSTDNKLYRYNGSAWTTAVPTTDLTGQVTNAQITDSAVTAAKIASGAINVFDKFAGGLEPVSAVSSLPSATGYTGPKTVLLTTDNKLYRYTGSAWTVAVPTTDLTGQITTSQITDNAVTTAKIVDAAVSTAKFASGIEPVSIVSSLPSATGYTGPKTVLLTTDNKLYRYTGSAWTVAVPTTDLTGQVTETQITDLAVSTPKLAAGAVTTAKITAGAVTANEIAANAVTADKILAGAVVTAKLAASAVTANEIATDAVTAGKILAGSVTTAKLAASAVTANEIATDAVTANKILAGSVTTAKIAAGAVTANEIASNTIVAGNIAGGTITANKLAIVPVQGAALNIDPNFTDSTAWSLLSGTAGSFVTITDGIGGNTALRSATGAVSTYGAAQRVPVIAAKTYRVRALVRHNGTANGTLTLGIAVQDASGTNIIGDGTYWFHAANAVTPTTIWSIYSGTCGGSTAKTFPVDARTMIPFATLNSGGTAGYLEIQDLRIEEAVPGELIVDGVISAAKIATDAVTANKIQAGAIVAGKIAANAIVAGDGVIANAAITNALIANAAIDTAKIADLAVTNAKIASVTVEKIVAGSMAVGQYIESTVYTPGSAGWRIKADGSAEMNNLVLRGGIYASYGLISGITIYADALASSNWTGASGVGSVGWAIYANGDFYANTINARGQINSGSFTGYSWPATGGTGAHLSSSGLMIGNANDGKYFQVTGGGDIYAPKFSIVGGDATFNGLLSAATVNVGDAGNPVVFRDSAQPTLSLRSVAHGQILYSAGTGGAVVTGAGVKFTTNNGATAIAQRLRTGLVRFSIHASGVVDHYFSLWYRVNGGAWTHIYELVEPQSGVGTVAATAQYSRTFALGDYIEFGMSATNSAGSVYNPNNDSISYGSLTVLGFNF